MKFWQKVVLLLFIVAALGLCLIASSCVETEQKEVQKAEQVTTEPKCNSGRCYPGEKANSKLFNYNISDNQVQEDPEIYKGPADLPARQEIMRNRAQIRRLMKHLEKHCQSIQELCDRTRASTKGSMGIEVKPVPVPIIPVPPNVTSPRLPPTRINKSKKFTLLWPIPQPFSLSRLDYPKSVPTYSIHLLS